MTTDLTRTTPNCVFQLSWSAITPVVKNLYASSVEVGMSVWSMRTKGDWSWEPYFFPLFVHPPVNFISVPNGTPTKVRDQLLKSFAVLWSSPSAAANHVRIAIEDLLTALRPPKARRNKGSAVARIDLHSRIELLRPRAPSLSDPLLAIKWIGNAGSHLGDLTRDDVFDAYDILEIVLDDLYVKKREAMQRLIRQINRRKGPKAKRKTSTRR